MDKFDFDKINEAFRAGNRARKKESAQDAVESVDGIQAQIDRFMEQTGKELEIRDGRPYFDGDLWLKHCTRLTSLPDRLKVGGDLDLEGCTGLTSLPDGLEIGGYLEFIGCAGLTRLPDRLKVGGGLLLDKCTGLTSLPDNLEVNEYLSLKGCTGLTSLPTGLKVEGSLDLRGCTGLTGLPSDLIVQGACIQHKGVLTPFFKKLGIRVNRNGDTKAEDWRRWQKAHGYLTEAFRAGNKARKKESTQDAVQSVAVHGWNPDEVESLWDDMTFKSGFSSENIDAVNGEFSCHLELNPLDFDIELSITKYDGRMAELYADIRSSDQGWEFESFTGSCNNMENLFKCADDWIRDTIEELNEHAAMYEAFKAGNKARKKESGQDAAAITDPMKSRVNFKDPFIAKAMKWGGIVTMEDCMEEDSRHFEEVINYAKDLAVKSHSAIKYFPEFEFFSEVDYISDDLFAAEQGCGLEEITFHDRLSIGIRAFKGSYLRKVKLSDVWQMEINACAFSDCRYLEKVTLASAIEYESNIFSNCTSLSEVSFDDCEELYDITANMFSNCKALEQIELPAGLKNIKSQAFYGSGLRSITLPQSIEHINSQAFAECLNLTTVRFLGDYCEIEDNAFRDCVNLRNIRANSRMFRYLYRYHRNLLERLGVPKGCRLLLD